MKKTWLGFGGYRIIMVRVREIYKKIMVRVREYIRKSWLGFGSV